MSLSSALQSSQTCGIRYDTIYLRALKSWRNDQLSLAHRTETKNKEKLKIKKRLAQKNRCGHKSGTFLAGYFVLVGRHVTLAARCE